MEGDFSMLISVGALLVSYIVPLAMYFFLLGNHAKEDAMYRRDCRSLFIRGLLLGFPVFFFSLLTRIVFNLTGLRNTAPIFQSIFYAFVTLAFSEELMKYLAARKTIKENVDFISFLDVVTFACIPGIGFEILEAAFYVLTTNVPQILVRGITNMHCAFALIVGFIIATGYKKGYKWAPFLAVFVSTLIHGSYDLFLDELLTDKWGGISLAIAVLCIVINIYTVFAMRKQRKDPYFTAPLFPPEVQKAEGTE